MTGPDLTRARRRLGLTQEQAAARLGVSQPYLSLLEKGARRLTPSLAAGAVRAFGLAPTELPLPAPRALRASPETLVRELSALGYPGFAHRRSRCLVNPAQALLTALQQESLEARVAEALPWLLLRYPDLDHGWLADRARRHNLQNRLGFVAALALAKLQAAGETGTPRHRALLELEAELESSRLAAQHSFGKPLASPRERKWVLANRPAAARHWNVVSDLKPEHLPYAA
jgi:transcriptional regulator with XRE-family HTH domain